MRQDDKQQNRNEEVREIGAINKEVREIGTGAAACGVRRAQADDERGAACGVRRVQADDERGVACGVRRARADDERGVACGVRRVQADDECGAACGVRRVQADDECGAAYGVRRVQVDGAVVGGVSEANAAYLSGNGAAGATGFWRRGFRLIAAALGLLPAAALILTLTACAYEYERTYPVLTEEEELSALPCERADSGGFLGTRLWSHKEAMEICSLRNQPTVSVDGVQVCAAGERCSDEALLPYQPCAQPMPKYYGDLSATQSAEGILLIHPMTRTQILCYDLPGESAAQCAENFRAAGYVLVTDVPQVTAKYDFLRNNTYPTRRWRNGETVPRW